MTPKLTFRNPMMVPPGGYYYHVPETGFLCESGSLAALVMDVRRHLSANDKPIPVDLPAIIEDNICRRIPASMCKGYTADEAADVSTKPLTLSLVQTQTTHVLKAWRAHGRQVVGAKEAEERAVTCVACEFNSRHSACASCTGLRQWVRGFVPQKTRLEDHLFVCQITGVMNTAHINFRAEPLRVCTPSASIALHPPECWKRRLLEVEDEQRHAE